MNSAIVIVNWNSAGRLKQCLVSLPVDAPIVVVDNASADDSLQQGRAARSSATFIENSANRGLAAAINQGFAATSSALVSLTLLASLLRATGQTAIPVLLVAQVSADLPGPWWAIDSDRALPLQTSKGNYRSDWKK